MTSIQHLIDRLHHHANTHYPLEMEYYGSLELLEMLRSLHKGHNVPKNRKLFILFLGGGQAGIITVGVELSLRSLGVLKHAYALMGVSSGAATVISSA